MESATRAIACVSSYNRSDLINSDVHFAKYQKRFAKNANVSLEQLDALLYLNSFSTRFNTIIQECLAKEVLTAEVQGRELLLHQAKK